MKAFQTAALMFVVLFVETFVTLSILVLEDEPVRSAAPVTIGPILEIGSANNAVLFESGVRYGPGVYDASDVNWGCLSTGGGSCNATIDGDIVVNGNVRVNGVVRFGNTGDP